MKSILCALVIINLFFSCNQHKQDDDAVTHEWKNLIVGNELVGWNKQGKFTSVLQDGILTLSSENEGGWLLYQENYEDFIFETEFLVSPDNISGITFRYVDEQKGDPAFTGYKVNLDHNLNQQNPTGSIVNVSRAKWLKSTKPDEWNKISLEAKGDHLKVFINDTLVTETHNRRSNEGMIGLQAYGKSHKAQFRNTRIKELEEVNYLGPQMEDYMRTATKSKLVPLVNMENLEEWDQIGDAVWDIKDEIIHGYSGEKGGFLIHKKAYRNFYLKLKFKIKHEDNSGIFIRHTPADKEIVTTDNAIECNIYDHDGYLHEYSTGSIAPIARSWSKMIDYEDWNDMEIFAFEDQICMYVNGIKSSEAHLPQKFNQKGNICIQGGIQLFNGNLPSDIYIRDLYIKDFDEIPFLGF